ncbi:hypothetical protein [Streptomyces sp. NPDC001635]
MRICRKGWPSASTTQASSSSVSQARFGYNTSILKRANPIGQSYAGSLSDVSTSQQGTTTRSVEKPSSQRAETALCPPVGGDLRSAVRAGDLLQARTADDHLDAVVPQGLQTTAGIATGKHPGQHSSSTIRRVPTGLPVRVPRTTVR